MASERTYRGATIRPRLRGVREHGWWLIPDGPLRVHPDKGWVRTLDEAHREIDRHVDGGGCLLREGDRWLGVLPAPRRTSEPMFDLMLRGLSAWCAARQGEGHEPCGTIRCACSCHETEG